jgi:c-di-GMP-binding flagellar brake protein YcgR
MKTPKPILERRRALRVHEALPFKIGHDDFETLAKTINISVHGALCLVEKNIPVMTQLAVALTLPGTGKSKRGQTVRMKGVVVRREKDGASNRYYVAIYFSDISAKSREALSKFIESRVSDSD